MAIRSDTFGSVRLTGRDADRFVQQVKEGAPNPAARDAVKHGRDLARMMQSDGKVIFETVIATHGSGKKV